MPAFDVVCRVDLQEVDNAIQQTLREIAQRFDFKNQPAEVRREETAIHLHAADDFKLRALADILREKMGRRQVPLRALQFGTPEPGPAGTGVPNWSRSEEHTSELQSQSNLVCRLLLEKKKKQNQPTRSMNA